MFDPETTANSNKPWAGYQPSRKAPWELRRVAHLHRRAGFSTTWNGLQRDLKDGHKASIDRLLAGRTAPEGMPKDFDYAAQVIADSAVTSGQPGRVKGWWIYRMLFSPDPLAERLTLMWHNHFATSNVKVKDLAMMRRQNDLFRKNCRAPFGELLKAVIHDPAILLWLDAEANRKAHPNENMARELMELFTLGIGNYTETDIKEAARALTGWVVEDGAFAEIAARHDAGDKSILGRRGRWKGDDLIKILLDQPAIANRLAFRLCELLMGEGVVSVAAIEALAEGLRQHNLDIGWAVETVLRSDEFFAADNLGNRVLGPVEYVVGVLRALELFNPAPSTLVLADWMKRMGQDLFYPPNVGGWNGGRAWLTTRALIVRTNFAAALVDGIPIGRRESLDATALAERHSRAKSLDDTLAFYGDLLLGSQPDAMWSGRVVEALDRAGLHGSEKLRQAIVLVLSIPQAQIG
jgi:uncharacterized protein (DUF1800 family)